MTTSTDVAGERGRTTIADRVVERVAAHAVTDVEGVGGSARRVLGMAVTGEDPTSSAKVTATVTGERAAFDVRLSVAYPASVAATTERARTALMRRVEDVTGLVVSRVDISVTALHSGSNVTRRVQ